METDHREGADHEGNQAAGATERDKCRKVIRELIHRTNRAVNETFKN